MKYPMCISLCIWLLLSSSYLYAGEKDTQITPPQTCPMNFSTSCLQINRNDLLADDSQPCCCFSDNALRVWGWTAKGLTLIGTIAALIVERVVTGENSVATIAAPLVTSIGFEGGERLNNYVVTRQQKREKREKKAKRQMMIGGGELTFRGKKTIDDIESKDQESEISDELQEIKERLAKLEGKNKNKEKLSDDEGTTSGS